MPRESEILVGWSLLSLTLIFQLSFTDEIAEKYDADFDIFILEAGKEMWSRDERDDKKRMEHGKRGESEREREREALVAFERMI